MLTPHTRFQLPQPVGPPQREDRAHLFVQLKLSYQSENHSNCETGIKAPRLLKAAPTWRHNWLRLIGLVKRKTKYGSKIKKMGNSIALGQPREGAPGSGL